MDPPSSVILTTARGQQSPMVWGFTLVTLPATWDEPSSDIPGSTARDLLMLSPRLTLSMDIIPTMPMEDTATEFPGATLQCLDCGVKLGL